MILANGLNKMSTRQRYNLTAIIYDKRGRALSIGKNSYVKTSTHMAEHARLVGQPHKIYLHAEVAAILKCQDLSKAHRIKVFRFHKDGSEANAAPCEVCRSAIAAAKIRYIEHT